MRNSSIFLLHTGGATKEYILGPYGMAPWGSDGGFPSPTAKWIWNTPNANFNATPGAVSFTAKYTNILNDRLRANLYVKVDDTANVYVDGGYFGSVNEGNYKGAPYQFGISFPPGDANFLFKAFNKRVDDNPSVRTPAGLIYAVIASDTNELLIYSGQSREYRSIELKMLSVLMRVYFSHTVFSLAE